MEKGKEATPMAPQDAKQDPSVKIFGFTIAIKYLSLLCLVVQNSSLVLTMRYSRTVDGPLFITTTAVVLSELLKMLTSIFLLLLEDRFNFFQTRLRIQREVLDVPWDMVKLSVPAILYTLQNNLQYVAVSNLDAATFQVTYQLKILTTALFSVVMLQKSLDSTKWLSLFLLTIGVGLVQIPPDTFNKVAETAAVPTNQNPIVGLVAVLTACILSGFAGVYFEKILKGSQVSVWIRNIQLGFYGVVIGLLFLFFQDWETVSTKGFFYGYQAITYIVIFNQAFGGLLVAVVVKYADNILKGYATSFSIIISCVFSVFFFNFIITWLFIAGSALVIFAVYLYS